MDAQPILGWRYFRHRFGKAADSFLYLVSAIAVATFLFDQMMSGNTNFSFFGIHWTQFQHLVQIAIWSMFLGVYVLMGSTSHRNWQNYARKWWLETIILVTWAPFPHEWTPQALVLLGSIAHVVRMARWTRQTFTENALFVIGVSTLSMNVIGTALLMVVEPQTYSSYDQTSFTVFMTAMTMGPAIPPVTTAGRAVFYFISAGGVTIVAIFVGVMREYIQRLMGHRDLSLETLNKVMELKAAVEKLIAPGSAISDEFMEQLSAQRATIASLEGQLQARQQTVAVLEGVIAEKNERIALLLAAQAASEQDDQPSDPGRPTL